MAEKLTGGRKATVTKLPDRAARGAGKSKPTAPKVKLGSSVPPPKVKSQAERDAEIRSAQLDRRRMLAAQDREIDVKVEVIREQMKTLLTHRKQVRNSILQTGIPLALYDEAKADSLTSRVDLEEKEKLRAEAREVFGVPCGVEKGLFDGLPDAAKEEAYWDDIGYRQGLAATEAELPKPPKECPAERQQAFLKGWERGAHERIEAVRRATESETGSQPDIDPADALAAAAQAGNQPAENPDASHVSSAAATEREVDEAFEMSDDERAAQAPRRAAEDEDGGRLNPTAELSESVKTFGTASLATAKPMGIV